MAETTMEACPIPTEEPGKEKKKRKFLPSLGVHHPVHRDHYRRHLRGSCRRASTPKLLYDADSGKLEMTTPHRRTAAGRHAADADDLGVKIEIDQFTSGAIPRPCPFPAPTRGSTRTRVHRRHSVLHGMGASSTASTSWCSSCAWAALSA